MATMGRYCKAYPIARLREFSGWTEEPQNTRKERRQQNGTEAEVVRELTDDAYLYLQENFTVTNGVFLDEDIIFDQVTPEWIEFCKNELKFEVPVYESAARASPE